MTAKEAWNSMMAGKKVRWTGWFKGAYIYYDEKSLTIKDHNNISHSAMFFDDYFSNVQWEIYKEDERRNTMNFEEAKKALLEGKKVRCVDWAKNTYIYFDDKNLLVKSEKDIIQTYGIDKWAKHTWELYEEPKKVFKVFISQPMNKRFKYEIINERDEIKKAIEKKYGEEYQIEYLNEDSWERPKEWTRIQNLGFSIMNMYNADIVVFAPKWDDADGCIIEHNVAWHYEKKFYVCVISDGEYILR